MGREQEINDRASKLNAVSSFLGVGVNAIFADGKAANWVMTGWMQYALFPVMVGFVGLQAVKDWMQVHEARINKKIGEKSPLLALVVRAILTTLLTAGMATALGLMFCGVAALVAVAPFIFVGAVGFGGLLQLIGAIGDSVASVKAWNKYKTELQNDYNAKKPNEEDPSIEKQIALYEQEYKKSGINKRQIADRHDELVKLFNDDKHKANYDNYKKAYKKATLSWMKFGIAAIGLILLTTVMIVTPGAPVLALAVLAAVAGAGGLGIAIHESRQESVSQNVSDPMIPDSVPESFAHAAASPAKLVRVASTSSLPELFQVNFSQEMMDSKADDQRRVSAVNSRFLDSGVASLSPRPADGGRTRSFSDGVLHIKRVTLFSGLDNGDDEGSIKKNQQLNNNNATTPSAPVISTK